ncbi:BamA/TamA family outer membrane protein [candidate division KSB1 bacterium]|nr:BamA/TamA family outer membrane protein [candidate division KSB1 bacterium]
MRYSLIGSIASGLRTCFLNEGFFIGILTIFCIQFGLLWTNLIAQTNKKKTVRNIFIKRQDVFPEITGKPRFLYNWANSLHIVTKESVIRQELLFEPGDEYDPELLQESERNLRALAYFGDVEVFVKREEAEFVDVAVVTQDQWSTLVSYIFNQGGGRTEFGGSIEEFNLLGLGKRIFSEIRYEQSEGTTFTLRYSDPQLFFTRWTTEETLITGPFIQSFSAEVIRPFFALDTKWAGGVSGNVTDRTIRLFDSGEETSRLRLETQGFQILGGRAFGSRFRKTRLQLTYRFQERVFISLGDLTTSPVPDDELIHALTLTARKENISFVEEKRIDRFVKTEDLTLGNISSLSLGRTGLPIPKGVTRFELNARTRQAYRFSVGQYLIAIFGFQTLFDKDTIASLRLQYYNKLLAQQTFAFNLEFDFGEDLEESRQFLLGGDSGLRGFPAREFTGDKRLLINIEDRIFTPLKILTVALGGVVFLDAGNVWRPDEAINLSDMNFSVGFGLRLGYTKSPNSRVGRFDFGLPLNRGGGFGVSIGVDQHFSIN